MAAALPPQPRRIVAAVLRVLRVATYAEAVSVYVLYAFETTTRTTSRADLALGKARLKALREHRRGG